jgi:hypothetical protein
MTAFEPPGTYVSDSTIISNIFLIVTIFGGESAATVV